MSINFILRGKKTFYDHICILSEMQLSIEIGGRVKHLTGFRAREVFERGRGLASVFLGGFMFT